jgi:mono/diheme cytochrome c family protein
MNTPCESTPISEPAEPRAGRAALPIWLIILLFVLLYWGMVYFDLHAAWFDPQVYAPYHSVEEVAMYQPEVGGDAGIIARGKVVYEGVCALCHNPDGMGKPNQGPPFVGSEWVLGSPNRLIPIPLYGLNGPITVNGKILTFPSSMPAMGAALPDADLAAVLTYMRQAWGNKAPKVTPEQVKAVKAELGNRSQPFSPEELLQRPEK